MATLVSKATGNFTAAGTWNIAHANGLVNSRSGNTALTTSYVYSPNFTPTAVEVDAIAIKFRTNSGVGTVSMTLENVTDAVTVEEITVNASDIATETAAQASYECLGWYVFKLSAPVTLNAAKNYRVGLKMASSAVVTVWRSSTAGDWSKFLRQTATQAPAASDDLIICGEKANGGAYTSFVVTMDSTANTAYFDFYISNYGKLTYGASAATNYYLRTRNIQISKGGQFYIGESGARIPSDSTAVLEFNCASSNQYSLKGWTGSTFHVYGHDRGITSFQKLESNLSGGATSVVISDTTGWAANDTIYLAPSTTTASQSEVRTVSSITNGTTFAISSGTSFSRTIQASGACKSGLFNVTRNVQIRGISTTNVSSLSFVGTANTRLEWCSFRYMGADSSTAGFGYTSSSTATDYGTTYLEEVSFYDTATGGKHVDITGNHDTLTITNIYLATGGYHITVQPRIVITSAVINGVYSINSSQSAAVVFGTLGDYSNIYVAGSTASTTLTPAFNFLSTLRSDTGLSNLTASTIEVHSTGQGGISFSPAYRMVVEDILTWNIGNSASPIILMGSSGFGENYYDSLNVIRNVTHYLSHASSNGLIRMGTTSQPQGGTRWLIENFIDNNTESANAIFGFGSNNVGTVFVNGITSALQQLLVGSSGGFTACLSISDFTWNAVTKTLWTNTNRYNLMNQKDLYNVTIFDYLGVSGKVLSLTAMGQVETDTTFVASGTRSLRGTPTVPSGGQFIKLVIARKKVLVSSGNTVTVSVQVRKSVSGDGAAYNGAQPRLMLRVNPRLGFSTDDVVLDTATASSDGAWEELTGTTSAVSANGVLEFYVDCDGSTGWVNVDDFTTSSTAEDGSSMEFFDAYGIADTDEGGSGGGGGVAGGSFTFA